MLRRVRGVNKRDLDEHPYNFPLAVDPRVEHAAHVSAKTGEGVQELPPACAPHVHFVNQTRSINASPAPESPSPSRRSSRAASAPAWPPPAARRARAPPAPRRRPRARRRPLRPPRAPGGWLGGHQRVRAGADQQQAGEQHDHPRAGDGRPIRGLPRS